MNYDILIGELASEVWFHFVLTAMFGFLTGLEYRTYRLQRDKKLPENTPKRFGSSRTFTLIAILGFVLFKLDGTLRLYLVGMASLTLFVSMFYYFKLRAGQSGLLQPLISLIVYTYGPIASMMPIWFLVLLFVSVVFTLSARSVSQHLSEALEPGEMTTLAKFLLVSGVILPLLPRTPISPWIPASPFKIWLAVAVISSISYAGYILKKYFLKRQGYLVTGLLGGLYSSTATTVVLARKSHPLKQRDPAIEAGMLAATAMMYLRLLALVVIMNIGLAAQAAPPMLLFAAVAMIAALLLQRTAQGHDDTAMNEMERTNPLEFGIALLFAILFVVMMFITQQVIQHFGGTGLNVLSFVVGFTDIDPFVLSILSGDYALANTHQLVAAIVIAAGSNNLLKAVYALTLGGVANNGRVALLLSLLGVLTIAWGLFL